MEKDIRVLCSRCIADYIEAGYRIAKTDNDVMDVCDKCDRPGREVELIEKVCCRVLQG